MGSMIHLALGRFEIEWGKNNGFQDHSALFQSNDLKDVPYYYVDEGSQRPTKTGVNAQTKLKTVYKEGLSKPLNQIVDRIDLLGHTLAHCAKEFAYLAQLNDFDETRFQFEQLRGALVEADVSAMSADYGELGEDFGKFWRRQIFPRLGFSGDINYVQFNAAEAMENLSTYTILQLLALNPAAKTLPVCWQFKDVEDGGWAKRTSFIRPVDQSKRFLIVTEGSSDAAVLKHALQILKPHIADFFDFVDMQEGYPFSGTGNLVKFVQGLISIAVQNNVIVVFDNDAEGVMNFNRCVDFNVPDNMAILKLPDIQDFREFDTLGPNGKHLADINGQAAAIECYLDLDEGASVRWNNYNHKLGVYQGELIGKTEFVRAFLRQRDKTAEYNYDKILMVLGMIISRCISMREGVRDRELEEQLTPD